MGARIRLRRSIRVKASLCERRLPVRLAPCADELLSSWIARHAAFYAISPLAMLQHCLPELLSLRAADLNLIDDQVARIAHMFSIEPITASRHESAGFVRHLRTHQELCDLSSTCELEPRWVAYAIFGSDQQRLFCMNTLSGSGR
ncbi:TniQ family protein [Neorhizobium sp. JUb45]|uniref:TniQ family protein n=1 Tax=Neorhizobium sp. JUb45 TaxID=2485113 RepID=UPI001FE05AB7|nr:TniQ family protein [Neorhizobium sp. JUb45]